MAHNVVLVEKRTTGGKSVVHQSLTKKGRLSMSVQSLLNLQKGNLTGRRISIALRPVITGKTAPKHQFRISYTSIPCQLIRSPRMTLKPSSRWKWSRITVRNRSCVRLILALSETLSLWVHTNHSSQMHPVTLVAFPLASHHPAPSSLRLVDILLVIMALVYLNWIMVAPVNHTHSMLLMLVAQPY